MPPLPAAATGILRRLRAPVALMVLMVLVTRGSARLEELSAGLWTCEPDPEAGGGEGSTVLLLLGHADSGVRAGATNRRRARHALRVLTAGDQARTKVLLSGGAVEGSVPEAELLAGELRCYGYEGPLALESSSRTTLENLTRCLPELERAADIIIVSDPLHAAKARWLLRRIRPDLATRLRRAPGHRRSDGRWLAPARVLRGAVDLALTIAVPGWAERTPDPPRTQQGGAGPGSRHDPVPGQGPAPSSRRAWRVQRGSTPVRIRHMR